MLKICGLDYVSSLADDCCDLSSEIHQQEVFHAILVDLKLVCSEDFRHGKCTCLLL